MRVLLLLRALGSVHSYYWGKLLYNWNSHQEGAFDFVLQNTCDIKDMELEMQFKVVGVNRSTGKIQMERVE